MELVNKEVELTRINNGFLIDNYYYSSINEYIDRTIVRPVDKLGDKFNSINKVKVTFKLELIF